MRGLRMCLAAAVLMLWLPAAALADGYVLMLDGGAALLDGQGADIVPYGEYEEIYELHKLPPDKELYAAIAPGTAGYALLDGDGRRVTEFEYQYLEWAEGAVLFRNRHWKAGAMNEAGEILISPLYTQLLACGDGRYLALKTDPYDDLPDGVYLIGPDGQEQASGLRVRNGLGDFSEGLCSAASEEGRYGCLNASGEWEISPEGEWKWIGVFQGGLARAAGQEGSGLIDRAGNWVLGPGYEYILYEEGCAVVASDAEGTYVLSTGDYRVLAEFAPEAYGCPFPGGAVVIEDGCAHLICEDGRHTTVEGSGYSVEWMNGMGDQVLLFGGEDGEYGAGLYRADGTVIADSWQSISFLGTDAGKRYYAAASYETEQVTYDEYGVTFRDEVPGTRVLCLMDGEGNVLARFDAEYISWLDGGRIVVHSAEEEAMADLEGNILRRFDRPQESEREGDA